MSLPSTPQVAAEHAKGLVQLIWQNGQDCGRENNTLVFMPMPISYIINVSEE